MVTLAGRLLILAIKALEKQNVGCGIITHERSSEVHSWPVQGGVYWNCCIIFFAELNNLIPLGIFNFHSISL